MSRVEGEAAHSKLIELDLRAVAVRCLLNYPCLALMVPELALSQLLTRLCIWRISYSSFLKTAERGNRMNVDKMNTVNHEIPCNELKNIENVFIY